AGGAWTDRAGSTEMVSARHDRSAHDEWFVSRLSIDVRTAAESERRCAHHRLRARHASSRNSGADEEAPRQVDVLLRQFRRSTEAGERLVHIRQPPPLWQ